MEIRNLPIADLRRAPYNPRVRLRPGDRRYERIRRSIEEFDLVEPLVWNRRTGHLVSGHQRLAVLEARGVTEVPVSVVDLPPEKEKALNVTLNNPEVAGDWDVELLRDLVAELEALPAFDATLTGFDANVISALLMQPAEPEEPGDNPGETAAVEVHLRIDSHDWNTVKPELDEVVGRHKLECHVRTPEPLDADARRLSSARARAK